MLQLSEDMDDKRSASDSLLFVNKDTPTYLIIYMCWIGG